MKTLEGKLVSDGMKVGIVAARFNEFITSKLVSGAMDGLTRHNVKEEDIQVAWVPGTKAGNKGYDCALSAIEMVNLIKELEA